MCALLDNNDSSNLDLEHLLGTDIKTQRRTSALFILKLKETRRLSQAAIDDVVEGYRGLFDLTVQRMRCGVNACLADAGIDPTDVSRIGNVFTEIVNPFDGLETYYKQEAYFRKEFDLIVYMHNMYTISTFLLLTFIPNPPPIGTT